MDSGSLEDSIRDIVSSSVPRYNLKDVSTISSGRLHRVYLVTGYGCPDLLFSVLPPRSSQWLKVERDSLRSEAAILQWIADPDMSCRVVAAEEILAGPIFHDSARSRRELHQNNMQHLSGYASILIEHSSTGLPSYTPYNLVVTPPGVTVSNLGEPLTEMERSVVDFQAGQLIRRISLLQSPTKQFGFGKHIVPPVLSRSNWERRNAVIDETRHTFSRWLDAFSAMLNLVMQDAQAHGLAISYTGVKRCMRRFGPFLDAVDTARLVIVNAGDDRNLLVQTAHREGIETAVSRRENFHEMRTEDEDKFPSTGPRPAALNNRAVVEPEQGKYLDLRVTGLREWSYSLFGDPLMTAVFANKPSQSLQNGFNNPLREISGNELDCAGSPVEDPNNARVRLLLYQMYHAVIAIVKAYTSDDSGSFDREMEGRKSLVATIRKLDELGDNGKARRSQPIAMASPAKRLKLSDRNT